MVAGGIQAFVCGPIELIKTRQQVSGIGAMTKRKKELVASQLIVLLYLLFKVASGPRYCPE